MLCSRKLLHLKAVKESVGMVACLKALHCDNQQKGCQNSQCSDTSGLQIPPGAKGNLKVCRSCQNSTVIARADKGQDFEACQHGGTLAHGVLHCLGISWASKLVINKDWAGFSIRKYCCGGISDISSIIIRTKFALSFAYKLLKSNEVVTTTESDVAGAAGWAMTAENAWCPLFLIPCLLQHLFYPCFCQVKKKRERKLSVERKKMQMSRQKLVVSICSMPYRGYISSCVWSLDQKETQTVW